MMINCIDIVKKYNNLTVLDNINLSIDSGQSVAITAPSGAGKSTLLNLIAGLDIFNSGKIIINNTNISSLDNNKMAEFRLNNIGFIFQFHHLLPDFNLAENIAIPLMIGGTNKSNAIKEAITLLDKINLADRANSFINEISGGQRQRVAILRAIITKPKIIIADEPTGNLDNENANMIIDLLIDLCKTNNTTLLIATHNVQITNKLDKIYTLLDKKLCQQL